MCFFSQQSAVIGYNKQYHDGDFIFSAVLSITVSPERETNATAQ